MNVVWRSFLSLFKLVINILIRQRRLFLLANWSLRLTACRVWCACAAHQTSRAVADLVPTLVTVQASPSFLAGALPGLLAGPMQAAWVSGALVAAFALPATPACTLPRRLTDTVLTAPWRTDGWWKKERVNAGREGEQSKKEKEWKKGGGKCIEYYYECMCVSSS